MFEAAELGRKVSKAEFRELAPQLRTEMLEVQQELRKADFPVIIVFAGVHGAGKSSTINLLNEWMDPRGMVTHAYGKSSDEERERPEFWRYWRDLPPKGKIGLFLSSWYSRPVLDRVYRRSSPAGLDEELDRICAFEKTLIDDGVLILKFWMHLDKKTQRKRLKGLEKDPLQSWQVTKEDWRHWKLYDRFIEAAERTIMRTSTGQAPWTIVEGKDRCYRTLTVNTSIRDSISAHLGAADLRRKLLADASPPKRATKRKAKEAAPVNLVTNQTILQSLKTNQSLTKKVYNTELTKQQGRLNRLFHQASERGISTILVFEGWDAAGKGGAIRRMITAVDARDYQVIPIAAPTDEERAQHYLWRFWRHLSRAGRLTVFDRSWYGRVLVERVEGFAAEREWMRAYAEINHFEEQLVRHGIVMMKYWLHITKEEQLLRFKAREATPFKRWKLTEEDWRNRERWEEYEQAVNDMVERTSTHLAPWTLIEANNKRYARIKVIRTLCDRLEKTLKKK